MTRRRILVVGAGSSGLTAVKCCLEEGLEPVCLERTGDIAGLWNYNNSIAEGDGVASVMRSTVINTSKEMMSFSDFPIPAQFPNFMHNTKVLDYMRMYADAFNLLPYIKLRTEVSVHSAYDTELLAAVCASITASQLRV
jgi:dimethylaniline monooxygenase (N-oxide forming)